MSESKTELLSWLNDLLQLHYVKVEQCGSGAAYCQIIDSIYGDVPISKIKFASKHEYDYMTNFKILQSIFNAHGVEKNIPIEKLIKCRYNDNLEFLQWIKKYWDAFYPGGGYDAAARRAEANKLRAAAVREKDRKQREALRERTLERENTTAVIVEQEKSASRASTASSSRSQSPSRNPAPTNNKNDAISRRSTLTLSTSNLSPNTNKKSTLKSNGGSRPASAAGSLRGSRTDLRHSTTSTASTASKLPKPASNYNNAESEKVINDLKTEIKDLRIAADTLERERNFYYLKLRDLEILVLDKMEKTEPNNPTLPLLQQVQEILYTTEEGFVSPRRKNITQSQQQHQSSSRRGSTSNLSGKAVGSNRSSTVSVKNATARSGSAKEANTSGSRSGSQVSLNLANNSKLVKEKSDKLVLGSGQAESKKESELPGLPVQQGSEELVAEVYAS
ncbi:hypothetical protein HDV05_005215 [Chytridiales sp. JEL 0842]|nr:hypothetical protein HDV05_005215 [Chytridiales sp. JEL 0842]